MTSSSKIAISMSLALVCSALFGGMSYTIWSLKRENSHLKTESATTWNLKLENSNLKTELRVLRETFADYKPDSPRRVSRQASSSQTATEILADALNELIEKKLYTIMECNREEDNQTGCSLKPGPKGDKGEPGAQGKDGLQGFQGMKGNKGQHGYPGYKGDNGQQGPVGDQGPKGDMGVIGPKGEQGPTGPQGATGDTGARGEPGMKGEKGLRGYPGHKGNVGPKGEPGVTGPVGSKGDRGLQGERGQHGYPGYKGEKGEIGMTGVQGEKGMTGLQGLPGPPGPTPVLYPSEQCGGPGWRRVTALNMTNTSHHCPQGLNLTSYPIRSCGRTNTIGESCYSVKFPVDGSPYRQVCGRATAYRWGQNYAFYGYHNSRHNNNAQYVDGLSLTHGSPRTHIWTFASGLFNGTTGNSLPIFHCPCDQGNTYGSPPFVGNDYFCDSTATINTWNGPYRLYPDNALWDGQDCQGTNTCCRHNNPPWFRKELPRSISDNIELRMCLWGPNNADIALTNFELYVY